MSNHTTSTRRKHRTKLKTVKNQPSLGTFIDECQRAGISLKDLSKLADSTKVTNNKRQHQPTRDTVSTTVSKKKPTSNSLVEMKDQVLLEDPTEQIRVKMSEMDLLKELKNMERCITTSLKDDKENELKNMEERLTKNLKDTIDKSMKEAIQTLTSLNSNLVSENPVVQKNSNEVRALKAENAKLTKQVQVLGSEQNKLQHKILTMEQWTLENSLVFRGITKDMSENDYSMREKIYCEISHTLEGADAAIKLSMAKNMVIKRCKRVGRFS